MEQRGTADCAAAGDELLESGTEARALAAALECAVWEALGGECRSVAPDKSPSSGNDSLCLVRSVPSIGGEVRFYRGVSQPFRPHSHDFLVIGLVAEGERLLVCNGESRLIAPGDLIAFGPGDVHGCRQQGEAPFSYISITASPHFMAAAKLRGPVVRDTSAVWRFAALVHRLLKIANDEEDPLGSGKNPTGDRGGRLGPGVAMRASASATGVKADPAATGVDMGVDTAASEANVGSTEFALALLLERLVEPEPSELPGLLERPEKMFAVHSAAARRMELKLREQLSSPIDLRNVAIREGISEYALIRAYRRCYSITPIQHLISLRTEEACRLLATGKRPAEVAREAGFADQAHLTRAFKQRVGTTPAAYRKMVHREGSEEPLQ